MRTRKTQLSPKSMVSGLYSVLISNVRTCTVRSQGLWVYYLQLESLPFGLIVLFVLHWMERPPSCASFDGFSASSLAPIWVFIYLFIYIFLEVLFSSQCFSDNPSSFGSLPVLELCRLSRSVGQWAMHR